MSLPALYKMTDDFNKLMELEDDGEVVNALIDICSGEIEKKAENICKFVKSLELTAKQFQEEEKRIYARRKSLENLSERTRLYMQQSLLTANIEKLTAGTFKISVGLSPGTTVIDDLSSVPPKFLTVIPEQYVPDKNAIKAAIKAGESVPGARIDCGFTMRIS
jgi:hypothetical protein